MSNTDFYNDLPKLRQCIEEFKKLEKDFQKEFGLKDIVSNSKIYEIAIANKLGHKILSKMSNSKDAIDSDGGLIEYKHFKETSSNHSWTFNDYSDRTIEALKDVKHVVFAHYNDTKDNPLNFDWYYDAKGWEISDYLFEATKTIKNKRKMINVSPKQLEEKVNLKKLYVNIELSGIYSNLIERYISLAKEMEYLSGTTGILTSNKLWEVVVGLELGHKVNSEQGGRGGAHDAEDIEGGTYEYKVAKSGSWNFQDISENVLSKYLKDKAIITAKVDKENFEIVEILSISPQILVPHLRLKLEKKRKSFEKKGKELRRLQVSVGKREMENLGATKLL
mgnify:CR=1 FL=1